MRSALLASAALILCSGAALAQTSAPAPTGAPNAASTTGPSMSPGNMAPSSTGASSSGGGMSAATPQTSTTGPAPTGAPNEAQVTTPGMSPGNTAPATGAAPKSAMTTPAGASKPAMKTASTYHSYAHHTAMAMPANGTAGQYLHIAKMAIKHHDKMTADTALSNAETIMLDRSVPQGQVAADDSPGVTAIEHARAAVASGNMTEAAADTDTAMSQMHGMMNASASSDGGMGGTDVGSDGGKGMGTHIGSPGNQPLGGQNGGPATFGGPTEMPANNQ